MRIKVAQILPNPFRDYEAFPPKREKVDQLKHSIGELGFWENVIVRLKDNDFTALGLEPGDTEGFNKWVATHQKLPEDVQVELGYGYHRLVAIKEINETPTKYEPIEEINIPLKALDDDMMLKIMVQENHTEWGAGISVMIESVSKVLEAITKKLDKYGEDDFDLYLKDEKKNALWDKSADFKKAKGEKGIGFEKIKAYMGGEWDNNNIQGPLNAIKASQRGIVDLDDCKVFTSGSALMQAMVLMETIHDTLLVPPFFKERWKNEFIKLQVPGATSTVKELKDATKAIKDGRDPIYELTHHKPKKIDVIAMIGDYLRTKEIFEQKEVDELEGFEGWEEQLDKAFERVLSWKKRKDAADQGGGDQGGEGEGGEGEGTITEPTLEGGEDEDTTTSEESKPAIVSIEGLTRAFSEQTMIYCGQAVRLRGRLNEVDAENTEFFEELQRGAVLFGALYLEAHGEDALTDLIGEVIADAEKESGDDDDDDVIEVSNTDTDTDETEVDKTGTDD